MEPLVSCHYLEIEGEPMQPWTIEKIRQERQEEKRIQLPLPAPEPLDQRKPEMTPAPERGTSSIDFELKT
jgi:hypothetical protein